MDHKQQHHEHHRKEREEHKKEQRHHEHGSGGPPGPRIHPLWFLVLGVVLTLGAVLVWIVAF